MYNRDMPLIKAHALASKYGLTDVITFVLLTIQQPFQGVVRVEGRDCSLLFGSKRAGFDYATEHAAVLHAAIVKAVEVGDVIGALDVLTNIPGLGVVKAAFVAQLCGLEVGCLDSHNMSRLRETKMAKIKAYVATCAKLGGSEYLWNSWCDFVAGNRGNKRLTSGDTVSAFHVECFNLA
jgi:hypothetical protein